MDWIGLIGRALRPIVRNTPPPVNPARVLVVKLCCIGDVIFTTPLLACLREAWPDATIDWLIDEWAREVIENHPALDHVYSPQGGLRALERHMAKYDLVVVPDRSSQLSMAAWRSRAPHRAGLDSGGRGFGYTIRAPTGPDDHRHESEIYLDIARILGLDPADCQAYFAPTELQIERINNKLKLSRPFVIMHPGGGANPGAHMPLKRWPARCFAALAERCVTHMGLEVMVLGGPGDGPITAQMLRAMRVPAIDLTGQLNLGEAAALAQRAALYIGNDTGMSHLAAAAGARVLMIFGPSDPRRYGPFRTPGMARCAWHVIDLPSGGVSAGAPENFDWDKDGVTVEETWHILQEMLSAAQPQ